MDKKGMAKKYIDSVYLDCFEGTKFYLKFYLFVYCYSGRFWISTHINKLRYVSKKEEVKE